MGPKVRAHPATSGICSPLRSGPHGTRSPRHPSGTIKPPGRIRGKFHWSGSGGCCSCCDYASGVPVLVNCGRVPTPPPQARLAIPRNLSIWRRASWLSGLLLAGLTARSGTPDRTTPSPANDWSRTFISYLPRGRLPPSPTGPGLHH